MTDWLKEIAALQDAGEPAVLVTVAGVRGSAPREVGAKMLVTARDCYGTIGGGALEYQCTRIAAERLQQQETLGCLRRFPLGSDCGQCCGGVVDILFEPLAGILCMDVLVDRWSARQDSALLSMLDDSGRPAKVLLADDGTLHGKMSPGADALELASRLLHGRAAAQRIDTPGRNESFLLIEPLTDNGFDIAVFGAGHVGSALVHVLAGVDCNLRWIDSRRGVFPDAATANMQCIASSDPARDVAALPPGAYYFVMTHSHALDLDITAAILRRGDFAYCGLIGSATKRKRFEGRLLQQGFNEQTLQRLTCPIGIAGITGKTPREIAIAAAAELLRRRERQAAAIHASDAQVYTLNA